MVVVLVGLEGLLLLLQAVFVCCGKNERSKKWKFIKKIVKYIFKIYICIYVDIHN